MGDENIDLVAAKAAISRDDAKILFVSRFKHQTGKSDKGEVRILAITPNRIYVITTAKTPKIDFSFHILEIYSLEGTKSMSPALNDTYLFQLAMSIQVGEKQIPHRFLFEIEEYVGTVISFIVALLRTNFVNANCDKQITWKLSSSEKQEAVEENINSLSRALSGEGQACGSFSLAYLCICDYYKQTSDHNAEVCWDIDKIYASHGCKDFNLDDFDRLDMKDLIPLIATLAYNTWFTRLCVSSIKLPNELIDVIVKVIRRTLSIEEIILQDCHLNKDQVQRISLAFAANSNKVIKRVDLSKNNLEDKGVSNLCGTFGTMQNGLEMINLSEVGMTSKGATNVVNCLKQNKLMSSTLAVLNLSGNSLRLEGIQSLCDFFSQPNVVTDLVLSNTECPLDLLFTALHRGCQLSLQNLDISANPFFGKKTPKDAHLSNSLSSLQQFFSMSRALKSANLSSTKIPSSAVKAILVGLLNNPMLTDVALDLSSNELKSHGAEELKSCLKEISLSALNLSNNGLEQDLIPICEALQKNHAIRELDLSLNVNKAKNISQIADAMSDILEADTPLTKLSVADNKLRVHAGLLFDAVGTNETLVSIDIRGNTIGDEGARMLAKALQINTKLSEILMDRNNVTPKGLQDIAQSMDRNYILKSLPLPVADLAIAMKANTSQAFLKSYGVIEQAMIRNQSSKQSSTPEQAYKVHQGLLMSSIDHYTHHIDQYVIQLEDTIAKVKLSGNDQLQEEIKTAAVLIKEAELFRQVVLELYSDPENSKGLLDDMFNKVTDDIVRSVECVIKDTVDKMMKSATNICPTALNKEGDLKLIKEELLKDNVLIDKSVISDSIMQVGRSEITYKLCESNLMTATNIAEQLKTLFVSALQNSINTLNTLYDNQVSEAFSATEQQNGKVNGQLENIKLESISNEDDEVIVPPISTPAFNLLSNLSSENTFDLSWEFTKSGSDNKRDTLSSVRSDKSDDSISSMSIETCRRRLNTDTMYQGRKKKKNCSLKRRPTFYKESNEVQEVEIDIDSPERKASPIDASLRKPTDQGNDVEAESVPEIQVDVLEQTSASSNEQNVFTERSKSVDNDDVVSTASTPSVLSSSPSIDDSVDGEEVSLDAFDDVSQQSSQLSVTKRRARPQHGRRPPTRVSNLAHMKADENDDDDALSDDAALSPAPMPRPKSEGALGNQLIDEAMRPRLATEKLKREPPARPSPPTPGAKHETPTRPDPPSHTPKAEVPTRPERPKKPELEKKPDSVKEKKVKPPTGAFQLPALPNLSGMLKKRHAPKAPDTVDGAHEEVDTEHKSKEDTVIPVIVDADTPAASAVVDTPPTKPPPPSVMKRSNSPTPPTDGAHSLDTSKSPEPVNSADGATKPSPIKKPPRGIPMGGLGGSALMAEMNKKLHIPPKSDEEDQSPSPTKPPVAVPPKPQKPTPPHAPQKPMPPQRPPSMKRPATSIEGRPNVPDRPKSLHRSTKSHDSSNENEQVTEGEKNTESSDQSNVGKSSEESETVADAESQDAAFV